MIARMQENPAFANVRSNDEGREPRLRVAADHHREYNVVLQGWAS